MATSAELIRYAQDEIAKAKAGQPLSGFAGYVIPPPMLQGASVMAGAYQKSAYWLAIAARLAGAARKPSANDLTKQAQIFLDKGNPGIFGKLSGLFNTSADNPEDISKVFYAAASVADQGGVSNVAKQLRSLGSIGTIEERQDETRGWLASIADALNPISQAKRTIRWLPLTLTILVGAALVSAVVAWTNRKAIAKGAELGAKVIATVAV